VMIGFGVLLLIAMMVLTIITALSPVESHIGG
jgi:hypothetical protein